MKNTVSDDDLKDRPHPARKSGGETSSGNCGYDSYVEGINSTSEEASSDGQSSESDSFLSSSNSGEEDGVKRWVGNLREKHLLLKRGSHVLAREKVEELQLTKNPIMYVSHVERMTANQCQDDNGDMIAATSPQLLSGVNMFCQGQWMAQALVWSNQATGRANIPNTTQWRLISDPLTCTLGLMPPSAFSMKDSVSLEEAIHFTDEPRLVAQASPPFCVVHVNKAFLTLAGLRSSREVIGKPIESVVQVAQEITGQSHGTDYLQSVILASKNKACRIRVVPVVDRSKRRRLTSHRCTSYMSHVLVPILPAVIEAPRRSNMTTVIEQSDISVVDSLYGTVG